MKIMMMMKEVVQLKLAYIDSSFNTVLDYLLTTYFSLSGGWVLSDIANVQLEEYISYDVWLQNVVYRSSILNDNFIVAARDLLKVYWNTNIADHKQEELELNHDNEDIHNLSWKISKSKLKKGIIELATVKTKFVDMVDEWDPILDLTWNLWNDISNGWKSLWDILYYKNLTANEFNVDLWNGTDEFITWKKTIVLKWSNLYIKSNMINTSNSDILWIIVLTDENWNWWKLYIDPSVKRVDAVIYTEKSVIGWHEISWTFYETDWNTNSSLLQNQLYIYWSVFSENTIWASRSAIPLCPYYTKSISWFMCTVKEAQKYDLNYFRHWYSSKYDSSYWDYPLIIKYNWALQNSPPPLFDL